MGQNTAERGRAELPLCPRATKELYAAHLLQGGCKGQEQAPTGEKKSELRGKHALGFKQGGLQV